MVTLGEPRERNGNWYISVTANGDEREWGPYRSAMIAKRIGVKQRNILQSRENGERVARAVGIGPPDGTLNWYARAMDSVAETVLLGGGKEAREDLKSLAMASVARRQLYDMDAAERELKEAQALLAERRRAEIHGTRLSSTGTGAVVRVIPGAAVR